MADTSYIVEIASQISGVAESEKALDAIAAKLTRAGATTESLEKVQRKLSQQLELTKVASGAAAADLAKGNKEYARLEGAAIKASKALENAGAKATGTVPAGLAKNAATTKAALDKYTKSLRLLEQNSAKADAKQAALKKTLGQVSQAKDALRHRSERLTRAGTKLSAVAGLLPGRFSTMASSAGTAATGAGQLSSSMSAGGVAALGMAAGVAVMAAGMAAATLVMVKATKALNSWILKSADAERSALLTRKAFGNFSTRTRAVVGDLDQLEDATGLSADKLMSLATSFEDMRLPADQARKALRAAALAEAALGEGGSTEFLSRMKNFELSVDGFVKGAERAFGGVVAKKMISLDATAAKLDRTMSRLFRDIEVDGVLGALSRVVDMLSTAHPIGKTLQNLLSTFFKPFNSGAQEAFIIFEAVMLEIAIQAVKAATVFVKLGSFIRKALGIKDSSLEDKLDKAGAFGKFLGKALVAVGIAFAAMAAGGVVVLGVLAVAMGVVLAGVAALALGVVALGAMFVAAFYGAIEWNKRLWGYIKQFAADVKQQFGILWNDITKGWETFTLWIGRSLVNIGRNFSDAWNMLSTAVGEAVFHARREFELFKFHLGHAASSLVDDITAPFKQIPEKLKAALGTAGKLFDGIKNFLFSDDAPEQKLTVQEKKASAPPQLPSVQDFESTLRTQFGAPPEAPAAPPRPALGFTPTPQPTTTASQIVQNSQNNKIDRGTKVDLSGATFNVGPGQNPEEFRAAVADAMADTLDDHARTIAGDSAQ